METRKEKLLRLRGAMAHAKQCKPYMIFSDIELEALLKAKPTSIEQLGKIKGFPSEGYRVKNFGQAIVDIFVKAEEEYLEFKTTVLNGEVFATTLTRSSAF